MDEIVLIKEFQKVILLIKRLQKSQNSPPHNHQLSNDLETKDLRERLDDIKIQLINCPNKSLTFKKVENLFSTLNLLLNTFSNLKYPITLSKNQLTIIQSNVLRMVRDDIHESIQGNSNPHISDYRFEIGGDFDTKKLIKILEDAINSLKSKKITNYVELWDFIKVLELEVTELDPDCGKPVFNK
jgi:hypothetical protein